MHPKILSGVLRPLIELVTYELLKKGATKTGVIIQVENDENVQFYRDLIMNEFTSEVSTTLLHDVVNNYMVHHQRFCCYQ